MDVLSGGMLIFYSLVVFCCGYFFAKAQYEDDHKDTEKPLSGNTAMKDEDLPEVAHYYGRVTGQVVRVKCICAFQYNDIDYVLCALRDSNLIPPFPIRREKLEFDETVVEGK